MRIHSDCKGHVTSASFKILILILCIGTYVSGYTQNSSTTHNRFSFNDLTVNDGLSQNSVVSIAQDTTGFLWFATQDGLNQYDGREFKILQEQFEDVTRPSYSKLGKVYIDSKNTLWAITNPGTLKFYDEKKGRFQKVEALDSASVIYEDPKKNLYVGTFGRGLYRISHDTGDTLSILDKAVQNPNIHDLIAYKNDLWIAASGGVFKLNPKEHTLNEIPSIPDTNFSSFAQKDNTIYVGSYGNGLFMASNDNDGLEQFNGFKEKMFPKDLVILDLLIDQHGKLWVATYGQGLYIIDFNSERISHFMANKNNPNAIHYNDILSLFEDASGTVWLGTDGAGLSYFDQYLAKFNTLTNKQLPRDIHVDVIRAIAEENGTIWLGTSGKGLTKIRLGTQQYRTIKAENSNLLGDRIMSLHYDGTTLWIGHQDHGLQLMDSNGTITTAQGTQNFTIWKILDAPKDRLWLCTRNHGLILYDKAKGKTIQYTAENSGLSSNNIRTAEPGKQNILWIGTEQNGLFLLDVASNTITGVTSIPDKIKSLYYNSDTLWIGTNGNGLKSYVPSNGNIQHFTTQDGLPNNVIYGILPDAQHNLWLSTNKGISKFSVTNGHPDIENYENYDGLQSYEFNTGAYFKADDGTLYFGGLEGLNWFKPDQLETNPFKPKTVITNVKIFNASRNLTENVPLKHTQNTITFTFSSLQFSQPKLNEYKYRLTGYDEDWVYAGNNNEVRYTNLPPGEYNFQVMSSNYDGVWGNIPASYDFEIEQPWHFTNMAIAVFTTFIFQGCFIAIGIFMLLLYFRLRKQDYLLYGVYILIFATYFFLRIDLELELQLFFENYDTSYYFLAPLVFLLSGVFIAFVDSFAEIREHHAKFSRELKWFSVATYLAAISIFFYVLLTKDFLLVKRHLNLLLLPLHLYGIYAVIRAFIVVKSPLRYYILLGNFFLIGFSMVGLNLGNQHSFSGGVESNNVFGFYSFNITQLGVFLELLVFSLGLGHKFYLVEIEKNRFQKLDELKTKLYTDISHEIRTPLTLISGPIEHQLGRTGLSTEDKKELSLIKNNAQRLLGLVNQMLDLSMIDSGHLQLHIAKGDLRGLLIQLVEAFRYIAKEKHITITYDFKKMDHAWFDRDVIEKIVSNLLSNAVKYAPKNSEVLVNAERTEDSFVFSILNSTSGMEIEDLGKLFQRFYQNNESTEGIGVGLALVRELVTLSNGSIIANNIGEDKIQFTLTLPITQTGYDIDTPNDSFAAESDSINSVQTIPQVTQKPSLLIVEDDKDVLSYTVSIFKGEYKVMTAGNGKEGVEMALKNLPDLIISDVMMPVQNGIELCHQVKSNELTSHIPVLLLTAKASEESQLKGLKTGADAYVTKPFNPNILKVRVEKLLENRERLREHYSKTFKVNPGLVPTKTEAEFLKRLQQVLDDHITSPEFTSEKFSELMYMSRSQLHKKLNAITGMSTTEFVRAQRINLATDLLRKSDAPISEIAYQVGFNTPSYFNKCFKEIQGCTPVEFLSK